MKCIVVCEQLSVFDVSIGRSHGPGTRAGLTKEGEKQLMVTYVALIDYSVKDLDGRFP